MVGQVQEGKHEIGTAFDRMMNSGLTGETSRTSIVPVSFSRTMEMEVIMAQISIRINPNDSRYKVIGALHLRVIEQFIVHHDRLLIRL